MHTRTLMHLCTWVQRANTQKVNTAIMASGTGTNARNIIRYFHNHPLVQVRCVITNNPEAGVIAIAGEAGIPVEIISNESLKTGKQLLHLLDRYGIRLIVLAGFLRKIPPAVIGRYPQAIINIHPALLPAYGGKGMYGHHVHKAVIAAGEKKSGITIHYVDEEYDHGKVILQVECPVLPGDTPESLAQRIHELEYENYPKVIERIACQLARKN